MAYRRKSLESGEGLAVFHALLLGICHLLQYTGLCSVLRLGSGMQRMESCSVQFHSLCFGSPIWCSHVFLAILVMTRLVHSLI